MGSSGISRTLGTLVLAAIVVAAVANRVQQRAFDAREAPRRAAEARIVRGVLFEDQRLSSVAAQLSAVTGVPIVVDERLPKMDVTLSGAYDGVPLDDVLRRILVRARVTTLPELAWEWRGDRIVITDVDTFSYPRVQALNLRRVIADADAELAAVPTSPPAPPPSSPGGTICFFGTGSLDTSEQAVADFIGQSIDPPSVPGVSPVAYTGDGWAFILNLPEPPRRARAVLAQLQVGR